MNDWAFDGAQAVNDKVNDGVHRTPCLRIFHDQVVQLSADKEPYSCYPCAAGIFGYLSRTFSCESTLHDTTCMYIKVCLIELGQIIS